MKDINKHSKQFLLTFSLVVITLLIAIAAFIWIIDPFFQYRIRDKQYILNPIYNNPGIAKYYDYNTVIIGSSMVQNFDLNTLRKDGKTKPVKLASGAINIPEIIFLYNQTNKEKTDTYIINLDMIQFNEWLPLFRYPKYLFSENFSDRLKYHFAYESVVRYGITDAILYPYIALTDEENIPEKLKIRYSIDDIGNFRLDAIYNDVDRIKEMYHNGQTVSYVQTFDMDKRMVENIDKLLTNIAFEEYPAKKFIFILPPYSALYWHITKKNEYYQQLIDGIRYLCKQTSDYSNVHIQFFYNLNQITDLSRYSDVTHFDLKTSDYILDNLMNEEYRLTKKNIDNWLNTLDSTIIKFEKENADWL